MQPSYVPVALLQPLSSVTHTPVIGLTAILNSQLFRRRSSYDGGPSRCFGVVRCGLKLVPAWGPRPPLIALRASHVIVRFHRG